MREKEIIARLTVLQQERKERDKDLPLGTPSSMTQEEMDLYIALENTPKKRFKRVADKVICGFLINAVLFIMCITQLMKLLR